MRGLLWTLMYHIAVGEFGVAVAVAVVDMAHTPRYTAGIDIHYKLVRGRIRNGTIPTHTTGHRQRRFRCGSTVE